MATVASPAAGAVTIGQTGTPVGLCSVNQDWVQLVVSTGNSYVVPSIPPASALSITSWSHQAYSTPGQRLKLKIYRQVSGLTYSVVGQDVRPLTESVLNTFSTSIPVQPGDVLGITNAGDTSLVGCGIGAFSETDYYSNGTDTPPGETVTFSQVAGARLDVSAVVEPTNTFTVGETKRNARKGTATVTVNVPNPGEVTVSGDGVKGASVARGGAIAAKTVPGLNVEMIIKAKGKKLTRLKKTGTVKLSASFTYTPTNGSPSTQTTKVKLRKR